MPPVTGEPPLGGEEAADVANHEKGRPPDEIYEDDRMGTSSKRASTSKSTEMSAEDSERLGPFAFRKSFRRNLDHERMSGEFETEDEETVDEESGKSEHTFQQQRAQLVRRTWASIENVRKISSSLLVNQPQYEHIADHFKVAGDVLEKLGLGEDFVSGQVLEGGSDIQTNLTFDEMHFERIAETFEKRFSEIQESSRNLRELDICEEYSFELDTLVRSSEDSLSEKSKIDEGPGYRRPLWRMSMKEIAETQSGFRVHHRLDEFLCHLFEVVKHGEELVLFHSGLEGANNGVVERTGLDGEKFLQIHELLYKLLDFYACLEHCEGTEFARGYLPEHDSCRAKSLLYYLNSNCLGKYASVSIMDYFLNIKLATTLSEIFERPNCALKKLSIESSPGVKVDQEEVSQCRLMIIAALNKCVSITSLTVRGPNGKQVHELCNSLSVNKVLETLVISTKGPLADNDAMDLSAMLKENRSLKNLKLQFDDVSPEGVVYLGAMLTEISLDEIRLISRRGFRRVDLKNLLMLSMAYIDGKRNTILSVHDCCIEIRRPEFERWELPVVGSGKPEILCIIKKLNSFSIRFTDLDLDVICEILDSLKKNRTLKVLEIEAFSPQNEVNRGVAVCLESLLAENSNLEILKVRQLHIITYLNEGRELPVGGSGNTEILRIIKKLNCFSIRFTDLDPDAISEILDSLKKNKTLQVLEIEAFSPQNEVSREVAVCLESLLVENSSLKVLKVEFCAWDKCFVEHLLRPLMAEKDGEPQVNISLKELHIINYLNIDSGEAVESIAWMLRTNKTLSQLSFIKGHLKSTDICVIVDSLKINKDLQVLALEGEHKLLDDPQVKEAFIDLLVNYNFSLRRISLLSIEEFMKTLLELDAEMTLQELQSRLCTSLDSSRVLRTHDLKQAVATLQLEEGEGSTKEECGSSKMAFDEPKSKVEAKDERPLLFLSYSNEMRDFAMQLQKELKSSNYNIVGQDSISFAEVVDQCQLAIVVLSYMYVNSKPLMSELCTIVNSKRKVYPVFCKLTLPELQNAHLQNAHAHYSTFGGKGSSSDIALEREGLKFLCERKNEVSGTANDLVLNLRQGSIDVGYFFEEFSKLQRSSWPSNGLEFDKNAVSEEGYVHAIVEEILHYMPPVKEYNSDQTSGHQGKLEMESKLSLRQMKSLLESLPMKDFYLLRKFNMAQYLQEKYIQYSSFEKMCLPYFSPEQKDEYSKGRIAAALFPTTFLYHFKVHMLQRPHDGNDLRMLKAVAVLVAKMMQEECNESGVAGLVAEKMLKERNQSGVVGLVAEKMEAEKMQKERHQSGVAGLVAEKMQKERNQSGGVGLVAKKMQKEHNQNGFRRSTFFDFVDYGAPLDPRRTIAICQNSALKTPDGSTLLIIVQDDLTGAYHYQCVEASELGKPAGDDTLGVIGVEVTPTTVHVDNIHGDGSYYSGVLGDFFYKFGSDEDKQCAAKAFGDLAGAKFLSENRGIKCSPLLVIALASAIQKKGLTLTWSNGKGHMEFYPKLTQKVEVEASECQILYTGKINQLGSEIEWGAGTNSSAPHNQNEIQELGCNVGKSVGTSGVGDDGTPHNQIFQRGTNETQVPASNVDQSVGTSGVGDEGIVYNQTFQNGTNEIQVPTSNVDQSASTSGAGDEGTLMKPENKIAWFNATTQDKRTFGVGGQAAGFGLNVTWQIPDSNSLLTKNNLHQEFLTNLYQEHFGEFHAIPDLDLRHPGLRHGLLQCDLKEVSEHNYLVVYNESLLDDKIETHHVSIYEAIERDESVFEYNWIADILIPRGKKQIEEIFETGLRGRELTVRRDGSFFTQTMKPLAKLRRSFQEALLKFGSKLEGNAIDESMTTVLEPNLVGRFKSLNQWVNIIGRRAEYELGDKYWWKATSMEAMVYSRTRYKSGRFLTTETWRYDLFGYFGDCNVQEDSQKSKHECGVVISRGKCSRPPGSLLDKKILWGGHDIQLPE